RLVSLRISSLAALAAFSSEILSILPMIDRTTLEVSTFKRDSLALGGAVSLVPLFVDNDFNAALSFDMCVSRGRGRPTPCCVTKPATLPDLTCSGGYCKQNQGRHTALVYRFARPAGRAKQ